jgi:RNA polymerase sigma factor (sigma-70 family)
MEELAALVVRARSGALDAYGEIVRRFQDMAVGYSYSLLGDFHLAEDAALEAFIQAYRDLAALREPAAFPGWFRRIVFKSCDRLRRGKRVRTVPLQSAADIAEKGQDPVELAAGKEMKEAVLAAIRALPEHERTVTTLFYINGYSQKDIADFLDLPLTTVNDRLHASRKRLKERMVAMVEGELKENRPGKEFGETILRSVSRVEVRPEKVAGDEQAVMLVDEQGRCLPIIIGVPEEAAIRRALAKQRPPRPQTHELFVSTLCTLGAKLTEARITDIRQGTFYGELSLDHNGEHHAVDCRPSDAIALALMTGARITVAEHVMAQCLVRHADGKPIDPDNAWAEMKHVGERALLDAFHITNEQAVELAKETAAICAPLASLSDDRFKTLLTKVEAKKIMVAFTFARYDPAAQDLWAKVWDRLNKLKANRVQTEAFERVQRAAGPPDFVRKCHEEIKAALAEQPGDA